jgi:putative FmdB family regulatory protein
MPTYEYTCSNNHSLEEFRSLDDRDAEKVCPIDGCEEKLIRAFSKPYILFKGGGFFSRGG